MITGFVTSLIAYCLWVVGWFSSEFLVVIPVYWLSLVLILISIMNTLRKKNFIFLWGGEVIRKKLLLMNWESLAKPTSFRGWDINNLNCFGMELCMKSMWLMLTGNGSWNNVILTKYLCNRSLLYRVRKKELTVRNTTLI